jgi:hypothetical protein
LLVLHERQAWTAEDRKDGEYMAGWISGRRERGVPMGACLTGDFWPGRARAIAQNYCPVLLEMAYIKAMRDVKEFTRKAKESRKLVAQLKRGLGKINCTK